MYHDVPDGATIIHLAAVSTDASCKADPLEALDANVAGTINVAKAAKARNCRQFIFASTEWVYYDDGYVRRETDPVDPRGIYPWSKRIGEMILEFSALPNVTILRFGITYGPRDKNWCAVESIADKVLRGEDVTVGSLKTARRFIHVKDLCRGIMASIGRTGHETFNLAGDRLITLNEVMHVAASVVGRPYWEPEDDDGTPSIRNPDSTKAKNVLGWSPQIAFADGMREVVEYLRVKKP
jgi:nucleoside-diphosphate-sugar epimerase